MYMYINGELTRPVSAVRTQRFDITLHLESFIDVEERGRRRLPIILSTNAMKDDREILVRQMG